MVLKEQPLVGLRRTRWCKQRVFAYLGNINNLPLFVLSFTQPTPSGYEYPHGSDYPTQRSRAASALQRNPTPTSEREPLLDGSKQFYCIDSHFSQRCKPKPNLAQQRRSAEASELLTGSP